MGTIAVIPARNCERSISNVLRQVRKAGIDVSIVVVNGSTDKTGSVARHTAAEIRQDVRVCEVVDPLGPDVPRALGVIYALRLAPKDLWDTCVIVDGDWEGSFGRNLADYIRTARAGRFDVAWPAEGDRTKTRADMVIWNQALQRVAPTLMRACPSRAPLFIRRRICETVSPMLLCHPGLWIAYCVLASQSETTPQYDLGVIDFDARWLGNPTGSGKHQQLMQDTLLGDAVEGTAVLTNHPQTREWDGRVRIGYHADRKIELLKQWSASVQPCFV